MEFVGLNGGTIDGEVLDFGRPRRALEGLSDLGELKGVNEGEFGYI